MRAGIIIIHDERLALIERHRNGDHYYLFPGGQIEPGEIPEETAVREAREELGLEVRLLRLAAIVVFNGVEQHYYLGEIAGGEFGKGEGPEMLGQYPPERGTYGAVWMPLQDILFEPVLPACLAEALLFALEDGFPDEPLRLFDPGRPYKRG